MSTQTISPVVVVDTSSANPVVIEQILPAVTVAISTSVI